MPITSLPPFRTEVWEGGEVVEVVEPFTVEEYVPLLIAYVKEWAGEILALTDWQTLKAFETGTPMPTQVANDRALVRAISNASETDALAATTGEDLDAIPWASMLSDLDPRTDKSTPS